MKRTLASVVAGALALGGLVATATPASAHTPTIAADCDTLDVRLTDYSPREENVVTIHVDGEPVLEESFGSGASVSVPLDAAADTDWTVAVEAGDDPDGHRGWSFEESGERAACETPEPAGSPVQVAIYLYPKLDASRGAAWENSGTQELLGTKTLTLAEDELRNDQHWYTELPETDLLDGVDLCTGWGIQQDLLRGGPDEYEVPQNITYPDGSSMDGRLVDWQHQELDELGVELPTAADCDRPEQPEEPEEPVVVTPEIPAPVTVCGADATAVVPPANSEQVTYLSTEAGVVATPTEGNTFGADLAGYVRTDEGDVLFPIDDLLPAEEDCALVPGDIAAVCEGATPYLVYGVGLPEGIEVDDETPLTITFLNPDGDDYVQEDLPLEGRLLWPGASDTEPLQWPGYERQEDGSYTATDGNYAWTRDGVQVLFEVNPSYSTVVDYPAASEDCANPPADDTARPVAAETDETPAPAVDAPDVAEEAAPAASTEPELAATGTTAGWVAAVAVLLIGMGVTPLLVRRRLRTR
ncbi:hypothetical protein [Isoptericola sp. BMS4]|uniref:hypothetical protein n=1 Tax=Isoptericola sp. BMS4 TaxID=2527875 RepID=UPI00142168DF|nr:hypothetical protein [Isoptericola sp. BMS4]